MLVECKHCGAPLDVGASASIVRCSYCGIHNRVRSMRTIAEQAPPGWAPPPAWTPPPTWTAYRGPSGAPLPYRAPPRQITFQTLVLIFVLAFFLSTLCPFVCLPLLLLL
ncbi:MAG TPA: hypothetical protein VIL20_29925 [Sandaracinaceae bacterium]